MTKAFELSSKTWRALLKPWRSKAPIAGSGSRFFRAWSRPELNLQHSKAQGFKAQILQAPSNSTLQLGVPSPQKPNGHYFECQQTIFCSRESSFRRSDKSRVFFLVLFASNVASCHRKKFDRQFSASVGSTTSYQVLQHSGWVTASYPAVTGSNRYEKLGPKKRRIWVVVVAELVEPSHPTRELRGSNPIILKILSTKLCTDFVMEKTKIKKKRLAIAHL